MKSFSTHHFHSPFLWQCGLDCSRCTIVTALGRKRPKMHIPVPVDTVRERSPYAKPPTCNFTLASVENIRGNNSLMAFRAGTVTNKLYFWNTFHFVVARGPNQGPLFHSHRAKGVDKQSFISARYTIVPSASAGFSLLLSFVWAALSAWALANIFPEAEWTIKAVECSTVSWIILRLLRCKNRLFCFVLSALTGRVKHGAGRNG